MPGEKNQEWREIVAVILSAALVAGTLSVPFLHQILQTGSQNTVQGTQKQYQFYQTMIAALNSIWAFMTLAAIVFQAYVSSRQRDLMEGQLAATQTAADAALAALSRPWLFIESVETNARRWHEGADRHIAQFSIVNYGTAPAAIKRVRAAFFLGPHSHNGPPPKEARHAEMIDFPAPQDIARFMSNHSQTPLREVEDSITLNRSFVLSPINIILAGGGKETAPFYRFGAGVIKSKNGVIAGQLLGENYLIGEVYYELPGQVGEFIRFCYLVNQIGTVEIYRDYPPYNERKKAN